MNTELLNAISELLDAKLEPIKHRLDAIEKRLDAVEVKIVNINARFNALENHLDEKFEEQAQRVDTLLEGWTIQKIHRRELDNHEIRITTIEKRVPLIS
jgi:predicted  nucleic acid-binding Zn-ribbon protein